MSLHRQNILGVTITTSPKEIILEYIKKYLDQSVKKEQKILHIVTPNPEQIVMAQKNVHFAEMINQAAVALPDGIGVSLVIRKPRIPGVEFMEELVALAARQGVTIGLIGGYRGLADRALECLQKIYPKLDGWVVEPEQRDLYYIAEKIRSTHTRIVFVGLGAPKQELYIDALRQQLSNSICVLMSVGGSFDIIAGRLKRAPVFMRSIGFEWLWRLVQEPWRLKRQLALWKFVWLVFRAKLKM